MDDDKQKQEIPLIGRLFSLEALLFIMGILSLVSGFASRDLLKLTLGVIILGGTALFITLRRGNKANMTKKKDHERKND
jgi:hypothetical protein